MNTRRLIELIEDPSLSSYEEDNELSRIITDHPYSAVLKIVQAKIARVKNSPEADKKLTRAAIITADRPNLKNYMTAKVWPVNKKTDLFAPRQPETTGSELKTEEDVSTTAVIPEEKAAETETSETIEKAEAKKEKADKTTFRKREEGSGLLASDLINNIDEYKKLRGHFEDLLDKEVTPSGTRKEKSGNQKEGTKDKKEESGKQKKIKKEITDPDPDANEEITEKKKSGDYPVYEEEDPKVIRNFLNKLESGNEEKEEKENPKKLEKEEQVKLIENFIKSEPSITNITRSSEQEKQREDLSLPSIKFKDDIISENLAQIMIKQGKLDKATDIYKKLIWKFPQKKAYFASQIEELKKKSGK